MRIPVTDRTGKVLECRKAIRSPLGEVLFLLVAGDLGVLLASLCHELREVVLFRLGDGLGLRRDGLGSLKRTCA